MYEEDDLFDMTEKEFCEKYGITAEEYDLLQKDFQEV